MSREENRGFFFQDQKLQQQQQYARRSASRNEQENILLTTTTMKMNKSSSTSTSSRSDNAGNQETILQSNNNNNEGISMTVKNDIQSQQQEAKVQKQDSSSVSIVAYREFPLRLPAQYGNTIVPVATWFQPDEEELSLQQQQQQQQQQMQGQQHKAQYSHRISVPRIASLLANIQFIPPFVAKEFSLSPTISTEKSIVIDGQSLSFPTTTARPVVLLAHGFLGSRFDLSHLAEELASQGFICLSPEYPESLASSYDAKKSTQEQEQQLDRTTINQALLQAINDQMKIQPTSFGIVGHSLGCGTVTSTGDDTWTRVCIAGPPVRRGNGGEEQSRSLGGNLLAIASLNDGLVTRSRLESMIPMDFARLQEEDVLTRSATTNGGGDDTFTFPEKSILIMDRPDAPNHISFLAGNANDAMVSFLSPLLPVAQALSIPVLDFDKYKVSRDSDATAKVVIPIISSFLRQNML